jgi:adenylate cyclase
VVRLFRRGKSPTIAGVAAFAVALAIWGFAPAAVRNASREHAFDQLLPLLFPPTSTQPEVTIVDIDRAALARFGAWPWPREQLARVMTVVAEARPAAIGVDILLAGPDRFSSDGDVFLAQALAAAPSVLGFVLDTTGSGQDLPATPVLSRRAVELPGLWRAPAIIGPAETLIGAASGFGALVAAADEDGPIRRIPLLVMAGGVVRPGLAVETILRAREGGTLLIDADGMLRIAEFTAPLGQDAELRLPNSPRGWERHTILVTKLMDEPALRASLAGRIVLIGGSAPELGGLRVTPASPATPSVWLQAEAIATILRGWIPSRPYWADSAELGASIVMSGLGLLLAARLRPAIATGLMLLIVVGWICATAAAASWFVLLIDPVGPPALAAIAFVVAALTRFARDEWRARQLRLSFEQHLAPEVVRRIVDDPSALRLRGEMREITALFTDIEGFTAMTERAGPADLVALLDAYFEATTRVITDHGGMIDKIVGDAIHAIFNAPFSLDAHPERAVASALELLEVSETVRGSPLGQRIQLGRTRIGIETGQAIVGDVGGGRKLDYTAHGNAMNAAARLEAANKEFGSSICIGPGTAARLDPGLLRPIGNLVPRGQSQEVTVYTPISLKSAVRPASDQEGGDITSPSTFNSIR